MPYNLYSARSRCHMSRLIRKPTICICENKGADQLRSNCEADQRLCFRYTVQFLSFQNPKFPVSSVLLCLYSPVCVRPVRKPHCWFSHEAAQLCFCCLSNQSCMIPVSENNTVHCGNNQERLDACQRCRST